MIYPTVILLIITVVYDCPSWLQGKKISCTIIKNVHIKCTQALLMASKIDKKLALIAADFLTLKNRTSIALLFWLLLRSLVVGGMYKPRGQTRGVAQMITKLNNDYLVKVST